MVELYGVLNKTLTPIKYTGATTDTAQVNINQQDKTISVDVLGDSKDVVFVKFTVDKFENNAKVTCDKTYDELGIVDGQFTKQICPCVISGQGQIALPFGAEYLNRLPHMGFRGVYFGFLTGLSSPWMVEYPASGEEEEISPRLFWTGD